MTFIQELAAALKQELAMRAYRRKTPQELRLHQDPEARARRKDYLHRTPAERVAQAIKRKAYVKKNKAQLQARQKLHLRHSPLLG